jgi:hypothetical protein
VSLPNGTLKRNFLKFSSVGGTPTKVSNLDFVSFQFVKRRVGGGGGTYKPVALSRGQMEFILICFSPYSAARPLVAYHFRLLELVINLKVGWKRRTLVTAALLALYHTRPGLGLVAPMEAMLMMEPPSPWLMRFGMKWRAEWKMLFTFTAKTLSNSSSVTSAVGWMVVSFLRYWAGEWVYDLVFITCTGVVD